MPLAVVVARKVKGTAAAGIDRVGRVLEVPGAEVAVVEEESPAVRGVGDVLVDDTALAGGGGRLEPGGDCKGVVFEIERAGDLDVVRHAVEGQGRTECVGGPGGAVEQNTGMAVAGGIGGDQASPVSQGPEGRQPGIMEREHFDAAERAAVDLNTVENTGEVLAYASAAGRVSPAAGVAAEVHRLGGGGSTGGAGPRNAAVR